MLWGFMLGQALASLPTQAQTAHGALRVSMTVLSSCRADASASTIDAPALGSIERASAHCGAGQTYRSAVLEDATPGLALSVAEAPAANTSGARPAGRLMLAVWY